MYAMYEELAHFEANSKSNIYLRKRSFCISSRPQPVTYLSARAIAPFCYFLPVHYNLSGEARQLISFGYI